MARSRPARRRDHRSIGEVLTLLQEEYPDVTISKIRFLESQGLLDPERTPSGYRKFYDADVERLRWILHQQKEHFLPLKVIKDRLDEVEGPGPPEDDGPGAPPPGHEELELPMGSDDDVVDAAAPPPPPPPVPDASSSAPPPAPPAPPARPAPPAPPASVTPEDEAVGHVLDGGGGQVTLSAEELAGAADLDPSVISELERFGIVSSRSLGGTAYYDDEALASARLAGRLLALGVEPRHLRMYRTAVDREAGIYEAMVMPRLAQRRAGSHEEAMRVLDEVVRAGEELRSCLLRRVLRDDLQRR